MLLLPNKQPAKNTDRVMVLALWAQALGIELRAGMGRPTFPISKRVASGAARAWSNLAFESERLRTRLNGHEQPQEVRQSVIDASAVVGYGDPQGDLPARAQMANALSSWYNIPFSSDDIMFTTGGAGALHCVFEYLRRKTPHGRILTPFPHYSLYGANNNLFPIDVMKNKGYELTQQSVRKSIQAAREQQAIDHRPISGFIFCYPNNPLGTVVTKQGWEGIAEELRKVPEALIVLDEAYAEMDFSGKGTSLLTVAPDLHDRVVLMRSATKALSAAGERMAILACKSPALLSHFLEIGIDTTGHASRTSQAAFADALDSFDHHEQKALVNFYKPQVDYATARIKAIGAQMPDQHYKTSGTFYVLADLSDLLGEAMSDAAKGAFSDPSCTISTDEEIVYSLMTDNKIMVAPLSYYGLDNKKGFIRITCSPGERDLGEIINILEFRLTRAREKIIYDKIRAVKILFNSFPTPSEKVNNLYREFLEVSSDCMCATSPKGNMSTALRYKEAIAKLNALYTRMLAMANADNHPVRDMCATKIQRAWKTHKTKASAQVTIQAAWANYINKSFSGQAAKENLAKQTPVQRGEFKMWLKELNNVPLTSTKPPKVKAKL
jgi:aspartate aminotransferase/aminotransferase